ncbi:UNVERIFIED_CONTAM: ATPase family AAA domain-containing protein 1-A [Sesamum indicum]
MESKHMLMSALGVGIGVGVGLGLASGQTVGKWAGASIPSGVSPQTMEQEMLSLIVNGRDTNATFDQFPYYLSEQTRVLLTSAAFVHLKKADFSKHTRNLSPASRTILLSGPTEMYQQMLAKALAHYFEAKLLLLDVTDFSLKIQSKYGCPKETCFKRSISETTLSRMSGLLGSFSMLQPKDEIKGTLRRQSSGIDLISSGQEGSNPAKLRRNASAANINNLASMSTPATSDLNFSAPVMRTSSWCFDDKLFIQTLYKVLDKVAKISPIILYLRDVDKLLCRSERVYIMFQKMLKRLSGSVLILGSRIVDPENDYRLVDEKISSVFPYNIEIRPPDDDKHLVSWKSQLEEDMKMIQYQDNRNHIIEVLAANDLDCDDLGSICLADTIVLSNYIEEIVVSAISYHLTNTKEPDYRNGKLVISSARIMVGLPSVENREKILRTLVSKEKVEELDFMELAALTEGYSGSDLKNLCITAAYRPVRELIQQERLKDQEKKHKAKEGQESKDDSDKKERVITIRPLNMEDFKEAKKQVAASFAAEGSIMGELKQWNDLYGEGGSRKKEQLSYFLLLYCICYSAHSQRLQPEPGTQNLLLLFEFMTNGGSKKKWSDLLGDVKADHLRTHLFQWTNNNIGGELKQDSVATSTRSHPNIRYQCSREDDGSNKANLR